MLCFLFFNTSTFGSIKDMGKENIEDQKIVELGKHIKDLRKARSLTQRKMADKMNIDEASYQRIERGGTNPTFKTLYRVSVALEVEFKILFDY